MLRVRTLLCSLLLDCLSAEHGAGSAVHAQCWLLTRRSPAQPGLPAELRAAQPAPQFLGTGVSILPGGRGEAPASPTGCGQGAGQQGEDRPLTRPRFSLLLSSSGMGRYMASATQLAKMASKMTVSKGLRWS